MDRSVTRLVIAIVLAGYGIYAVSLVPGLAMGRPETMPLLIGFVLQAICAFAAAIGAWTGAGWAPAVTVLLGVCVAGTWLWEGFVMGLIAYLHALLVAVIALVLAVIAAALIRSAPSSRAGV